MLHEILLSLSGHPSPLLTKPELNTRSGSNEINFPLLSPPERALLTSLSDLSNLHSDLRLHLVSISSSHGSIICRAVATHISSKNLHDFQQKILEVERSILSKDAGYVGGYGIVPLSKIVSEFAPWTRRLQWLYEISKFMLPTEEGVVKQTQRSCTGPALIDFLRREVHTGYEDLENMALGLIETAETTWLRLAANWLLYGKLPSVGADDLFIRTAAVDGKRDTEFVLKTDMLPMFVNGHTAEVILYIGKSLNQIRSRGISGKKIQSRLAVDPITSLLPTHLKYLESLKSPFTPSELSRIVSAIRFSLSQNALAHLLPLKTVVETIEVLHRFLLLEQGEFAASIVSQADKRTQDRIRNEHQHVRKAGLLDNLRIKEGEVSAVLNQTWVELASFQNEEDGVDDELELARDLIRLSISDVGPNPSGENTTNFSDLLFPTPTLLIFRIDSPLDLFLSEADVRKYSTICSFLLSVRRAELHLGSLWKTTSLRRCQPTPFGPPFSASTYGLAKLEERRIREKQRYVQLRPFWATASAVLFLVTELAAYLQGFVVHNHSASFRSWLRQGRAHAGSRPSTAPEDDQRKENSTSKSEHANTVQIQTLEQATTEQTPLDPATLSFAHGWYLDSLTQALFLNSTAITSPLHEIFVTIEHMIALFQRLASIHAGLDLEAEGVDVGDPTNSYAEEEIEVLQELQRTRTTITASMHAFGDALRGFEATGEQQRDEIQFSNDVQEDRYGGFRPWDLEHGGSSSGVEALVMRLDFLNPQPIYDEDGDDGM